uniref:Uncharacterized protein n=1 Tax=Strix occidentalis caurina TaxID=311401 RepID=A0A8D0EVA5_STROC
MAGKHVFKGYLVYILVGLRRKGNVIHPQKDERRGKGEHPRTEEHPGKGDHPPKNEHPGMGEHPGTRENPGKGEHPWKGKRPQKDERQGKGEHPGKGKHPQKDEPAVQQGGGLPVTGSDGAQTPAAPAGFEHPGKALPPSELLRCSLQNPSSACSPPSPGWDSSWSWGRKFNPK